MGTTKLLSTAGVGAAIVVGSMLAVNVASAHPNNSEKQTEVVDRLATELNVDSGAVQGVFDTLREEHQAEREADRAAQIAGLVADGTLTQAQADTLTAMRESAKTSIEALKDSGADRAEIKAAMDASRDELTAWAETEGIDLESIRPEHGEGRGGRGDHGDRNGPHGKEDGADDSTEVEES